MSKRETERLNRDEARLINLGKRDADVEQLLRIRQEAQEAIDYWKTSFTSESADRVAEFSAIVAEVTTELQATIADSDNEAPDTSGLDERNAEK